MAMWIFVAITSESIVYITIDAACTDIKHKLLQEHR